MNTEKQVSFLGKWVFGIVKFSSVLLVSNFIYVFLFLNGYLAETVNEIGTLITTGFVLLPFVFAPSFLAVSSCTRLFFRSEENSPIFRTFWNSYKKNYRLAMKHGLLYTAISFVLYAAYWYYGRFGMLGHLIPAILFILVTVLFLFVLSYSSDRVENILNYWKLSFLLLLNHPLLFLFMVLQVFFIIYFCHFNGAMLLFVAPGATAMVMMYFYLECCKLEVSKQREYLK
ncbi:DUF624 domain-containing protein [Jeotgalibaca ciconiae]|uniref:DUF624 domain-containing protein n=1 Tax=Jeotgalibaca ciconiae TaxID=2496265 RepID=A0A3Q9BJ46_9LACT|nr:DUF624 domain-containing protein [Jeotgalibaca ciconiae]AZP03557.1 DUF624 domain-containing protein [Jeotgalibaca ciconiae]